MKIPKIYQIVKFKGSEYTLISCNLGGKCVIKKRLLPNKNRLIKDVDIIDLKF